MTLINMGLYSGRFTTPDLLWSALPAQTPYHYAYNSPLTYRDPSGLAPEKEKEGEELLDLNPEDPFNEAYTIAMRIEVDGLLNSSFYDPSAVSPYALAFGGGGGSRIGVAGAGYNGFGEMWMQSQGNKKWADMTVEEKNETLRDANYALRKLSAQNGNIWEWSYTICESEIDGTNYIIATNFQTNEKSEGVTPDLNVPSEYSIVGTAHTHSGSNGDQSSGDLQNLYLTTVQQTVVFKNIDPSNFTSIVVSTDPNQSELVLILQITDFDKFQNMLQKNDNANYIKFFVGNNKWKYHGWNDIINNNLSGWGLQFNTIPIPTRNRPTPSMPGPRR